MIEKIKQTKNIEEKSQKQEFFEKINIYIHSLRKKILKTKITKSRNETEDLTTVFREMKRTIREYCKILYVDKLDN